MKRLLALLALVSVRFARALLGLAVCAVATLIVVALGYWWEANRPSQPPEPPKTPTQQVADRRDYASDLEGRFLEKGIDAHVKVVGKQRDTLRISWAAMGRPTVYNIMNSDLMNVHVPSLGFKKVILTDDGSFSGQVVETWTYNWNGSQWK